MVLAIFGYILLKKLVWDLADDVYDTGEELIFRKGDKEQRVKLKEIINVGHTQMTSPERITIYLRHAGPIGKELVFNPPMRLNLFSTNPLVLDLIERIDRERST